jgi:hypothetical protein
MSISSKIEREPMKLFKAFRPPNQQIVICDPSSRVEVPVWRKGVPWVATDTCILCMCMIDFEGETTLTLGPGSEVKVDRVPVFDGMLKTPGRRVVLETVWHDPVLETATAGIETRIRIWTNRLETPDEVVVGVD